ncbi:MAG TPA: ABC transporter substrate-binding protein [Streptosporangiaceae bacterium]|nr:ABC transporter substrate-binding protein [Streptosporangiaceae bacterium]
MLRKYWGRAVLPAIVMMITATLTASCAVTSGQAVAGSRAKTGSAAQTGDEAAFPVTMHAADGTIRLPSRPDKIISLSPTGTEMLYAIGAGRQVVAVGQYSDYPPQAPHTRLSEVTPSVESIAIRHPDLVVTDSEGAPNLPKQLAGFGIPVIMLPAAASLPDVYAQLDELGRATGHLGQAQAEARRIRVQIAGIVASVPDRRKPLTYYYELTTDYYSVTSSTFVGRLLGLLGLKSIADSARRTAAAGGYPQLSAESILKADPDYIFLADTICCTQSARTVAARPGWDEIAAVRKGHVVGLNDDIASRWGPRIVALLRTVADALRPGQDGQ